MVFGNQVKEVCEDGGSDSCGAADRLKYKLSSDHRFGQQGGGSKKFEAPVECHHCFPVSEPTEKAEGRSKFHLHYH